MSLSSLADDLQSGAISLVEWEAQMRDYVLSEYTIALELTKGGREKITQSDWGYLGSLVKKQYQYLDGFAGEIAANPEQWLQGKRLLARMDLYRDSAYAALEDMRGREAVNQDFDEESNELGIADHCEGCLEEKSRGWVPIGSLVPIGDRLCRVRCKCTIVYRKLVDGEYIYG